MSLEFSDDEIVNLYFSEVSKIRVLPPDEVVDLVLKAQKGDQAARDKVIKANLRLVILIAKNFLNKGFALPDLIQDGNIGLIHAIERFTPDKKTKFSFYASLWIRHYITADLMNCGRTIHLPMYIVKLNKKILRIRSLIAQELNCSEDQVPLSLVADRLKLPLSDVENALNYFMSTTAYNLAPSEDDDEDPMERLEVVQDDVEDTPEAVQEELRMFQLVHKWFVVRPDLARYLLYRRYGMQLTLNETGENVSNNIMSTKNKIRRELRRLKYYCLYEPEIRAHFEE